MSKKTKLKIVPSGWGLMAVCSLALLIAVLCGAPISPWWIAAPWLLPLAALLCIPLVIFLGIAILAIGLLSIIIIVLIPAAVILAVFGVESEDEGDSIIDYIDKKLGDS